jgi:hypothetical protein
LLPGPGLRGNEFGQRRLDDVLQVIPVIDIADIEIVFGAFIGLPELDFLEDGFAGFGHLDIEIIVADEPEQDSVAVDAIVPHHLSDRDVTGARALVDNELYKIRVASHTDRRLSEQTYSFFRTSANRGPTQIWK